MAKVEDKPKAELSNESPKAVRSEEVIRKDGFFLTFSLPGADSQTAAKYGVFFTALRAMEVVEASEVHAVAGSDLGAVTLDVERLTGTTAPGSGTTVLASTFNLKSTANTPVRKSGLGLSLTQRAFKEGDRIAVKTSGTLTALQGVQVTLYCRFSGRGDYR